MPTSYTKKKKQVYPSLACEKCGKLRQNRTGRPAPRLCRKCDGRPLADRFWDGVNFDGPVPSHRPELGPCWISGYTPNVSTGYPSVITAGRGSPIKGTHIIAWFLHCHVWPTLCILHLCDNRACVRWDHLFEGTRGDNNRDCVAKDRNSYGQRHPISKLTDEDVRSIRALYAAGDVSQKTLSEQYNVAQSGISRILAGRIWRKTQ